MGFYKEMFAFLVLFHVCLLDHLSALQTIDLNPEVDTNYGTVIGSTHFTEVNV